MGTEPWFRNPDNYIRELVECGQANIAWDRGYLVKKRIDPVKHAQLYFSNAYPYRVLLVGEQGTAEYRPGDTIGKPSAVYPTWKYGDDAELLEEIVEKPVGDDAELCSTPGIPADECPVFGQEHRVVVIEAPPATSAAGRRFYRYLKELQEDHPECVIHVHGLYGWRIAFGMGFGAADVEPRTAAQKGKVHLPSGKEAKYEHVLSNAQWVTALGFKPTDLAVPRNRCMYNIKSAVWAAENYEKLYKFQATRSSGAVDILSPDANFTPAETSRHLSTVRKANEGDYVLCDTCSLQNNCKYYRDGAVCSVPGAESARLSQLFKTRDGDTIIDALGTLLASQASRLERGMYNEEIDGELDPEVTKIANLLATQGAQLAKLVDPSLRSPKVAINVGAGGAAAVSMATPQQMIAAAVRELEARGIPRDKITPELIHGLLAGMANEDKTRSAIEGNKIIEGTTEQAS